MEPQLDVCERSLLPSHSHHMQKRLVPKTHVPQQRAGPRAEFQLLKPRHCRKHNININIMEEHSRAVDVSER